jgi:hypothetical protein
MNNTNDISSLSSFRYKNVYEKGKPKHEKYDSFSIKHPPMELSKRAKIFSPFDALKGFNDELAKAEEDITTAFKETNEPSEDYP